MAPVLLMMDQTNLLLQQNQNQQNLLWLFLVGSGSAGSVAARFFLLIGSHSARLPWRRAGWGKNLGLLGTPALMWTGRTGGREQGGRWATSESAGPGSVLVRFSLPLWAGSGPTTENAWTPSVCCVAPPRGCVREQQAEAKTRNGK